MANNTDDKAHLKLETWQIVVGAAGVLVSIWAYSNRKAAAESPAPASEGGTAETQPVPYGPAGSTGGQLNTVPSLTEPKKETPATVAEPAPPAGGEQTGGGSRPKGGVLEEILRAHKFPTSSGHRPGGSPPKTIEATPIKAPVGAL